MLRWALKLLNPLNAPLKVKTQGLATVRWDPPTQPFRDWAFRRLHGQGDLQKVRHPCVCQSLARGSNDGREVSPAKENMTCQSSSAARDFTEEAEIHAAVGLASTPFQLLRRYDFSLGLSFSGCPACCRLDVLEVFTDMPRGISSFLDHSPRAPLFSILRVLQ